ncbi:MAG: glycosyltransferase family 2 protein [Elusimicrobiota bacterium]
MDKSKILFVSPYSYSFNSHRKKLNSIIAALSKRNGLFFVPHFDGVNDLEAAGLTASDFEKIDLSGEILSGLLRDGGLKKNKIKLVLIVSEGLAEKYLPQLRQLCPLADFVICLFDPPGSGTDVYGYADLIIARSGKDKRFLRQKLPFDSKIEVLDSWIRGIVAGRRSRIPLRPSGRKKLTSIIIIAYNGMKYTRECIESFKKHTRLPYELILIDNGSAGGTKRYLKSVKKAKLVLNSENLSFAKAVNIGLKRCRGDYIVLLNNDVVLTDGWLDGMIKCIESNKAIGIVGPCTNAAVGQQVVPGTKKLKTAVDIQMCAHALKLANPGTYYDVHRVIAFCTLIKREVLDKTGFLDERFNWGGYEDYDYCLRVRQMGYKIMVAGDVFVYHHCGKTAGAVPGYEKLRETNRHIFIDKWTKKSLEFLEEM